MTDEFSRSVGDAILRMTAEAMANMELACEHLKTTAQDKINTIDPSIQQHTGVLRANAGVEVRQEGNEIIGTVGFMADYAAFIHQGTGIYATDGNGRQTPWLYEDPRTGETVITRGARPRPFLQEAKEEEARKINQILGGSG